MTSTRILLSVAAAVHALFLLVEMFPWPYPLLLKKVSKDLEDVPGPRGESEGRKWTRAQQPLVATIVQNAGIYNGILAGGLLWSAWTLNMTLDVDPARAVARVLLAGAAVAGIFGTATLKSKATAGQAILGIPGLIWLG